MFSARLELPFQAPGRRRRRVRIQCRGQRAEQGVPSPGAAVAVPRPWLALARHFVRSDAMTAFSEQHSGGAQPRLNALQGPQICPGFRQQRATIEI